MKKVSAGGVSRWVETRLALYLSETQKRREKCPTILGIDEHFFTKKKGFATTLVDLEKNKVFDVTLGRSEKSLEPYLKKLKGRHLVKLVLMDLSETYRSIIRKYFPNAVIVADRFHVVRLVFQQFQKLWHQIDPETKWQRGLGKLFRMHSWNLNDQQSEKLHKYLNKNLVVKSLYEKRNELCKLLLFKNQRGFQIRKHVKAHG